jgi:hypothetical protein
MPEVASSSKTSIYNELSRVDQAIVEFTKRERQAGGKEGRSIE